MIDYEKEIDKDTILDKIHYIKDLIRENENKEKRIEGFIINNNDLSDEVTNLLYESLEEEIENIQEEINSLIDSINDENNLNNAWNISSDNCEICIEFLEYIDECLQDQDIDKAIMILNGIKKFKDFKKINNKINKENLKQQAKDLKKQGKTNKEISKILNCSQRTVCNYLKEVKEWHQI